MGAGDLIDPSRSRHCRRIEQAVKKQARKLPGFAAPEPQQQSILEGQP